MTDRPVRTVLSVPGEGDLAFQEYFVGRRHDVPVEAVRFEGIEAATPAPGVLEALEGAAVVVIAPSNPIVSIGPVLAVPGVREVLVQRRASVVAVSPIVGGRALKGPADRLLVELGSEASVAGVARAYASVAGTLVIDDVDAALSHTVEAEGVTCVVTPTVMSSPAVAGALARTVLATTGAVRP
jgi:LPPG:FO 2-phospho-L-lactate transferase